MKFLSDHALYYPEQQTVQKIVLQHQQQNSNTSYNEVCSSR